MRRKVHAEEDIRIEYRLRVGRHEPVDELAVRGPIALCKKTSVAASFSQASNSFEHLLASRGGVARDLPRPKGPHQP
jgi:hypothetical protein